MIEKPIDLESSDMVDEIIEFLVSAGYIVTKKEGIYNKVMYDSLLVFDPLDVKTEGIFRRHRVCSQVGTIWLYNIARRADISDKRIAIDTGDNYGKWEKLAQSMDTHFEGKYRIILIANSYMSHYYDMKEKRAKWFSYGSDL